MKHAVALTLWIGGCTCGSPPAPAPVEPPTTPVAVAPALPVDHGAMTYGWSARLRNGSHTGLRAWEDGAVEVGVTGPDGLVWLPLRTLPAADLAAFDALRGTEAVTALPEVIRDPSAPDAESATWTFGTSDGPRTVEVRGVFSSRIPVLEELDRALLGTDGQPPRVSWVSGQTTAGVRQVSLPCDALSQRGFRAVANALVGVKTPGTELSVTPVILRVESTSLLHGQVIEVHDDGTLVQRDDEGVAHTGKLDMSRLAMVRSSLDTVPWTDAAQLCAD